MRRFTPKPFAILSLSLVLSSAVTANTSYHCLEEISAISTCHDQNLECNLCQKIKEQELQANNICEDINSSLCSASFGCCEFCDSELVAYETCLQQQLENCQIDCDSDERTKPKTSIHTHLRNVF